MRVILYYYLFCIHLYVFNCSCRISNINIFLCFLAVRIYSFLFQLKIAFSSNLINYELKFSNLQFDYFLALQLVQYIMNKYINFLYNATMKPFVHKEFTQLFCAYL